METIRLLREVVIVRCHRATETMESLRHLRTSVHGLIVQVLRTPTLPPKETRTCNRCGKYGHLKDYCQSKQNVAGVVLTSPVGSKSKQRGPNQNHPNPKRHKPSGNGGGRGNGNGQAPAAQASMLGGVAAGEPDVAVLLLAANTAANAQLDATAAAARAEAARVRFAANTK